MAGSTQLKLVDAPRPSQGPAFIEMAGLNVTYTTRSGERRVNEPLKRG